MQTHAVSLTAGDTPDVVIEVEPLPGWVNPASEFGVFEAPAESGEGRRFRLERHDLSGTLLKQGARYEGTFTANSNSVIPIQALIKSCLSFVCEDRGAILLHASAVMRNDRLWIFSGPKGSGKSTIARHLSGSGRIFSQDHVVLEPNGSAITVHTTPFSDEEGIIESRRAQDPAAVVFIEQSDEMTVLDINRHEAIKRFLSQTIAHTRRASIVKQTVDALATIVLQVDCFVLRFLKDERFWDLLDKRAGR